MDSLNEHALKQLFTQACSHHAWEIKPVAKEIEEACKII